MKRIFFMISIGLAALVISSSNIFAQVDSGGDNEKLSFNLDVSSGFVWRGLTLNASPVIQPTLTFTSGIFSVGAWASTPFSSGDYQEFDIFASLQLSPFLSIGITDYYAYGFNSWIPNSYFNFKKEETFHALDFQLMFEGGDNFPLKTMVSTIIGGDDLRFKDGELRRNFSTYIELGYGNTTKGLDWEIFTGFVPMESGFYEIDGGAIINMGFGVTKSFVITPTYSLPLSLKLSVNPAYESVFFAASIALF